MRARNWHLQVTASPPALPEPLSQRELKRLSDAARREYATQVRHGLRARTLTSPIHDRVAQQMTRALESALLEPCGARTILSLSAPYTAGKSTMVKRWAQEFHRTWLAEWPVEDDTDAAAGELPRWSPKPGHLADVIPVNYTTLLADSRATDLYAQLFAFTKPDEDVDPGGKVRVIVERAIQALAIHGTRMVIIDDAHMLRTTSKTGRATLDAIKHLNTELGELGGVLVLVGANLTGGDVLEDEQIRGRLAQHSFDAYEIDTDAGRRHWQRFLKTCEATLLPYLSGNGEGDFATKNSTYIWVRTQGFVSDAARLLIEATAGALTEGRARVNRSGLGQISLSQRAQDGERDLMRRHRARATTSGKVAG
ncbi:TniB family NTP-binding protein [Nocardioides rotundus]|uniref:TniB family NTP-binding protein n=1 Tax=Nocardioides rotundus TaxID=1774216 RepID=UPI001CBD3469|nr:TniB family NTP-binding protein [Nocardioides rotundus]UAL29885.1 TniB family NTP-binding protein [Nocardioides rotundus]